MAKRELNKKGIVFDITELLWDFLLVTVILICLGTVIFSYLNEKFNTDEAEISLLYSKLVYSSDCLAITSQNYQNNINANQGIIDLTKFEKENLKNCRITEDSGIKITLETITEKKLKELSFGPDKLINLLRVCDSSTRNFKCFKKTSFVSYTNTKDTTSSIKPAMLTLEVIKNV